MDIAATANAAGPLARASAAPAAGQKIYDILQPCFNRYHLRKRELAKGAVVLELGCAEGRQPANLADVAKRACGVDIAADAIAVGRAELARRRVSNVSLSVQNAQAMDFPDATFDLVFGAGILQLTDFPKALAEVRRVLKPGGVALFAEPLGGNPLINMHRRRKGGGGEGRPLSRQDLEAFRRTFRTVRERRYGLARLAGLPLLRTPLGDPSQAVLGMADAALLRLPGLKDLAWYALLEGRRA